MTNKKGIARTYKLTEQHKSQILLLMNTATTEEMAISLDLPVSIVRNYLHEVVKEKVERFDGRSVAEFASKSYENYEAQMREAWRLCTLANDPKERAVALEKVRQAQSSQDQLLKMIGVYVERKEVTLTIQQMLDTQEMKDMLTLLLDFLSIKKVDPEEFFSYCERRKMGFTAPIDVSPKAVIRNPKRIPNSDQGENGGRLKRLGKRRSRGLPEECIGGVGLVGSTEESTESDTEEDTND